MYDQRPRMVFPHPNPQLTPQEIVKIQLDALQNNDLMAEDAGIRVAYRFTSPANRAILGPLEQFIDLIKHTLYRAMIGFEYAELEPLRVVQGMAQQQAHIHHPEGEMRYIFILSRQYQEPFRGCWMTESMLPE